MSHLLSEELTPTALKVRIESVTLSRLYDHVKYTACVSFCQYFGKSLLICIDK